MLHLDKLRPFLRYRYWIFPVSAVCVLVSWLLAYQLRFDFDVPPSNQVICFYTLALLLSVKLAGVYAFGFHRLNWRYAGLSTAIKVGLYSTVCATALYIGRILLPGLHMVRGVILIDGVLTIIWGSFVVIGARLVRELVFPRVVHHSNNKLKTILIGAGDAGDLVLREITRNPGVPYSIKAIFDDNPNKIGYLIHGVRVVGTVDDIRDFVKNNEIDMILIATPSATRAEMRHIYNKVRDLKVSVKTLPSLLEMMDESRPLLQFRDINIQDLLGREEVKIRYRDIDEIIRNKVVLVTGAGGSIGSEICRQALNRSPRKLILLERSENLLFHVHRRLSDKLRGSDEIELIPLLMDCTDYDPARSVFSKHHPDIVLHAAAHKHVPLQEIHPLECFRNNIGGIQTMARVSHESHVERFVLISTDKAVNPVNVMGASKRACELYCQAFGAISDTKFMAVRFGNVLGSEGSVVPIFLEQIAGGGPVTLTHTDVTRYFMSIPEAVALVLQAASIGSSGQLMMLDMGEPVRIRDLARQLIFLAGKTEHEVGIQITGLRPGEKLYEELSCNWETCLPTDHKKIRTFQSVVENPEATLKQIDYLVTASFHVNKGFEPRNALKAIVPEYHPVQVTTTASLKTNTTIEDEYLGATLPFPHVGTVGS